MLDLLEPLGEAWRPNWTTALSSWEEGRGRAEGMGLTPPVGGMDAVCRTPLSPPVCRSLHVCFLRAVPSRDVKKL